MKWINTITLCGSTRFLPQFQEANVELTRRGFSVMTISMALPRETQVEIKGNQPLKELLDLVHFNKILRADAIFVVHDESQYIGFSTAREILWADMQGKSLFWMGDHLRDANPWDLHYADIRDPNVNKVTRYDILTRAKEAMTR